MQRYKLHWQETVLLALNEYAREKGLAENLFNPDQVICERPPDSKLGDLAFPMFPYAKVLKESPKQIAENMARKLASGSRQVQAAGPYVNIALDRTTVSTEILEQIQGRGDEYGKNNSKAGERIILEFSCPNTNKPLHLGHLRNDALGESLSRVLKACDAKVFKVNLVNDRGIHICKSMLAYKEFGENSTPEEKQLKGDHFVGDFYVRFSRWAKEDPTAEEKARTMLQAWEKGDREVTALWEKMNHWAIGGIEQTYRATGISFDKVYYESRTFGIGRDEVLRGYREGIFEKREDGSIWVDLSEYNLDQKVLLRSDGTSLYLTQDIGTALVRFKDWPFDRMIYVVASEQNYHFHVLFKVLELLGHEWAKQLYHLSYGMVNLPEGKMKSREGTVVDADDLLAELEALAAEEIKQRERDEEIGDSNSTAKKISLAALNYYLLQTSPHKDMIFNPTESLSFTGNTGPYLQYSCARICSMLRKYDERKEKYKTGKCRPEMLTVAEEWEIIKSMAEYPAVVEQAGTEYNPGLVANFLYELAKLFSRYYHENPVLHNEDADIVVTRITLARAVLRVMKNGFALLAIPFIEKM
ncbi:MAG: arginine--tRNA ligase [Spirochaetia bacterium]